MKKTSKYREVSVLLISPGTDVLITVRKTSSRSMRRIADSKVLAIIVGGRVVYQAPAQ